jgi:hypothetical protein
MPAEAPSWELGAFRVAGERVGRRSIVGLEWSWNCAMGGSGARTRIWMPTTRSKPPVCQKTLTHLLDQVATCLRYLAAAGLREFQQRTAYRTHAEGGVPIADDFSPPPHGKERCGARYCADDVGGATESRSLNRRRSK